MEKRLKAGDIVKHFKKEILTYPKNIYLYKIIGFATHTETKEKLVIYKSLYEDVTLGVRYGEIFARPYTMFMSKVDKKKYPRIKQKYRFEKYIE